MKSLFLFALISCLGASALSAQSLTPEQIASLKAKLETIKKSLDQNATTRHTTAGETFLQASVDPRAAVTLWENCVKELNFTRKGMRESDFREWRDSASQRADDPRFLESLLIQLRYLGLSCKAAEAESPDAVFADLIAYVESLSQMKELPTNDILSSVANSVFARAYDLQPLLSRNSQWESCPYNIAGIYEKTILPQLREKKPGGLMNAWEKRIDQQSRLAVSLIAMMDKEENRIRQLSDPREKSRDKRSLSELVDRDQSRMLRAHSKDQFTRETLPRLKWGKLKDQFAFVDPVAASTAMVALIAEVAPDPLAEEFFADLEGLVDDAQGVGSARIPDVGDGNP
ncbi:MAG: hypothetical protein GXX91_04370 [Verrucomicrobiaceae bacterium]|nr:hypothetical protein [Verrucomicrobiaceae bacterium]